MRTFDFKENDRDGLDTLRAISGAKKFNEWMYDCIKPDCYGDILEIGSGIGNISEFFLKDNYSFHASDIRKEYTDKLERKYKYFKNLKSVYLLDIASPKFDEEYKLFFNKFDTVFAINVIEHIRDDKTAIKNCLKLLKNNGTLIILVPAYETLYNSIDQSLYHYRRYTTSSLKLVFPKNEQITKLYSFNFMGIFAWLVSGKIFKNKVIKQKKMSLSNLMVPLFKIIDKIMLNKLGLSLIAVYKK